MCLMTGGQRNTALKPMFDVNVIPTNSSSNFADKNFTIKALSAFAQKESFDILGHFTTNPNGASQSQD